MASYHVLEGQPDGNSYRVVFHIPVPSVNNRIGVNYRSALVALFGGTSSLPEGDGPGQISTSELAQVASGAVFEFSEQFPTHPGENAAQIRSRIDARYTELVAKIQGELSGRLAYYGYTRDV